MGDAVPGAVPVANAEGADDTVKIDVLDDIEEMEEELDAEADRPIDAVIKGVILAWLDGLGINEAEADAFSYPAAILIPQTSGTWIVS